MGSQEWHEPSSGSGQEVGPPSRTGPASGTDGRDRSGDSCARARQAEATVPTRSVGRVSSPPGTPTCRPRGTLERNPEGDDVTCDRGVRDECHPLATGFTEAEGSTASKRGVRTCRGSDAHVLMIQSREETLRWPCRDWPIDYGFTVHGLS